MTKSSDDDALLAALLAGDRRSDEADVQARFAAQPELHTAWQQLRDCAAATERVGAADRELLAEALATSSPLETDVAHWVRQRLRPRRSRHGPVLLAIAALLAIVLSVVLWPHRAPPSEDGHLNGNAAVTVSPVDFFDATTQFHWTLPLGGGEYFRLRFREDGDVVDFDVPQSPWHPKPTEFAKLPAQAWWQVLVVRGGAAAEGTVPVFLQRR